MTGAQQEATVWGIMVVSVRGKKQMGKHACSQSWSFEDRRIDVGILKGLGIDYYSVIYVDEIY